MEYKKLWDKEYGTQWDKEVEYLSNKGITYTFIKKDVNGIRTWKYTKTDKLFNALAEFYNILK